MPAQLRGEPRLPSVARVLDPFQDFVRAEASGGIILLASAVLALIWANSPWQAIYHQLWELPLGVTVGGYTLSKPLLFWIDEGLMPFFFLAVGLEIKREMLMGELASPRRAALPAIAALGGMLAPAAIYLGFTAGTPAAQGWGIPMATDIAFTLGILALLASRIPPGLKVFLTAFAIVDDLGAVLVIAIFYTYEISWIALLVATLVTLALIALNRLGVHPPAVYLILGGVLWLALLQAGVHASITGVLVAFSIPTLARMDTDEFQRHSEQMLDAFRRAGRSTRREFITADHQAAIEGLRSVCIHVEAPAQRMERLLHAWVAFGIVPLFAFANAGVAFGTDPLVALTSPVSLGIVSGLVLGKLLGITMSTWLAVKSGAVMLPAGLTWRHVIGGAVLGGVGFTMSLFINSLAFTDPTLIAQAKIGILTAALIAGATGWIILRGGAAQPSSEPEQETETLVQQAT